MIPDFDTVWCFSLNMQTFRISAKFRQKKVILEVEILSFRENGIQMPLLRISCTISRQSSDELPS